MGSGRFVSGFAGVPCGVDVSGAVAPWDQPRRVWRGQLEMEDGRGGVCGGAGMEWVEQGVLSFVRVGDDVYGACLQRLMRQWTQEKGGGLW